jgi:hypothetical protein
MIISADAILGRGEYQKEKSTGGEILNKKGRKCSLPLQRVHEI